MNRWTTTIDRVRRMLGDRRGATAMEYALIGSLISIAIIGSISGTGSGVGAKWNAFANTVVSYLQ